MLNVLHTIGLICESYNVMIILFFQACEDTLVFSGAQSIVCWLCETTNNLQAACTEEDGRCLSISSACSVRI